MRFIFQLASAAGLVAALVPIAGATTIANLSVEQKTDASDLVVRGTVESVEAIYDEHGHIVTRADVRVTEVLKGDAEVGDYVKVESAGGTIDGITMMVPAAARYSEGEDAFLFLSEHSDGETYGTVAMEAGKYTVRPDPLTGNPLVVQFSVPYDRAYDARFIPFPPKAERVGLSTLEAQEIGRAHV